MNPIFTLIIGKIIDYVGSHPDEIINALKNAFVTEKSDPKISDAIQELGYEPTDEAIAKLHDVLKKNDKDTDRLASILVTKTVV